MKKLALLATLMLAGCATTGTQLVKVPVPVECRAAEPERPGMPTEDFTKQPSIDEWVQAALAEIERREGYETQLREALRACTKPLG